MARAGAWAGVQGVRPGAVARGGAEGWWEEGLGAKVQERLGRRR